MEGNYSWDSNGKLRDKDQELVVANHKSIGTPKFHTLSGNDFTSGMNHAKLHSVVTKFKKYLAPYLSQLRPFTDDEYPLLIQWYAFDLVDYYDLGNMWPWEKYIMDLLQGDEKYGTVSIIKDDSAYFVTLPGSAPRLIPVQKPEQRKYVWIFYRDDSPNVLSHPQWAYRNKL